MISEFAKYDSRGKQCFLCEDWKPLTEFQRGSLGYLKTCIACKRMSRRVRYYSITKHQFLLMFEEQDRSCKICKQPLTIETSTIDHNHRCCNTRKRCCGKCVRGLLCSRCNLNLSVIESDWMKAAFTYLGEISL